MTVLNYKYRHKIFICKRDESNESNDSIKTFWKLVRQNQNGAFLQLFKQQIRLNNILISGILQIKVEDFVNLFTDKELRCTWKGYIMVFYISIFVYIGFRRICYNGVLLYFAVSWVTCTTRHYCNFNKGILYRH